jgi:hypothetical protein
MKPGQQTTALSRRQARSIDFAESKIREHERIPDATDSACHPVVTGGFFVNLSLIFSCYSWKMAGNTPDYAALLAEAAWERPGSAHYRLDIQMTRLITPEEDPRLSAPMAEATLSLYAPDGTVIGSYMVRSGGHNLGELPGLTSDIDQNPDNGRNAFYPFKIQEQEVAWTREIGRPFQSEQGNGFYMPLLSNPEETDRGVPIGNPNGRGGFALHMDGNVTGSEGCVVFPDEESARHFTDAWNAIPPGQRPVGLTVRAEETEPQPDLQMVSVGHEVLNELSAPFASSASRGREL